MYCEVQLLSNIPYSIEFNFVQHGKVHANYMHERHYIKLSQNYMTGVTSSRHESSLSSSLVPQRKVGAYINYCMYTNAVRDDILNNII